MKSLVMFAPLCWHSNASILLLFLTGLRLCTNTITSFVTHPQNEVVYKQPKKTQKNKTNHQCNGKQVCCPLLLLCAWRETGSYPKLCLKSPHYARCHHHHQRRCPSRRCSIVYTVLTSSRVRWQTWTTWMCAPSSAGKVKHKRQMCCLFASAVGAKVW